MPSRWRWSTLTGSTLILHFLLLVAGCNAGNPVNLQSIGSLDFRRCSCDSATFCLTDADVIKVNMIYSAIERIDYANKEKKKAYSNNAERN